MAPFTSLRDRVRCYAAFGGTPRYLAAPDLGQSLDENIARFLLDPRGEVRSLVETALVQERGLCEVAKYQAILRAIGTGNTQFAEIKVRAGLKDDADTVVRRMVEKLIDIEYVRSERNVGAKAKAPYRYRIDDPAFAFYYAFVTWFEAALARNDPMSIWTQLVARLFLGYIGHVFEPIAEQAYRPPAAALCVATGQRVGTVGGTGQRTPVARAGHRGAAEHEMQAQLRHRSIAATRRDVKTIKRQRVAAASTGRFMAAKPE